MAQLDFKGRVAVVTGAGGGLGRAYALLLGSRGAHVVVNDLGGSLQGEGSSSRAADKVVEEIVRNGGKAIANHDSVEDGSKIIAAAIQNFGRIDILINNAGVLHDVAFKNMKDNDWDLVLKVHLDGAYKCCAAAWPYFRQQKYGRIINTSSGAGLFGNFGQSNYAAAKLALVGLTQALAKEGFGDNILVNAICPIAASRMTETVMTPELLRQIDPKFVAPVVAVLAHESNRVETGSIFEAGGGYVRKLRWERSRGISFDLRTKLCPEYLISSWGKINSFGLPAEYPTVPVIGHNIQPPCLLSKSQHVDCAIKFHGRVAVVSGAATRSGRAYACTLAGLGASIIAFDEKKEVNETVNIIRSFGGQAIACMDFASVTSAMNELMKVDMVVTTSDVPKYHYLDETSGDSWRQTMQSTLDYTYKIVRLVWPFLVKEKRGKVVIGTSPIGIYGQPGQAAYASATLGALGFARTLTLEGKKYNVQVNTIARHSDEEDLETASALMAALCSDRLPEPVSGGLYEVGHGGHVARTRWQATCGWAFGTEKTVLPEMVFQKLPTIANFDDEKATYPTTAQDCFDRVFPKEIEGSERSAIAKL